MRYFDEGDLFAFDDLLKEIEARAKGNDDLIQRLSKTSIRATGNLANLHALDPLSKEYIEEIRGVHEEVIGRKHRTEFEGLPGLNISRELQWPYPWGTECAETVARFLIAYGFLLRVAALPPRARILEIGCGMGSLTWNLARMGYRVDAIDPNETQCEFVSTLTRGFPTEPRIVAATLAAWLRQKPDDGAYDAVIFFESFHHLLDHQEDLQTLVRGHLAEDGKLLLAAEPIFESACDILPYEWGPRLDGESLRAMRKWGWLELGFTARYLELLFNKLGLTLRRVSIDAAMPLSQVFIGERIGESNIPTLESSNAAEITIDFSRQTLSEYVLYHAGLSGWEPWGRWSLGRNLTFRFSRRMRGRVEVVLVLGNIMGPNIGRKLKVALGACGAECTLESIQRRSTYSLSFEAVESDSMEITIPCPCRPKDLPDLNNADARDLGIGIESLRIRALR